MSLLFVVRHGNTFEAGEPPRRIGARTDLPLTATGLRQAGALGRHFRAAGVRFDRALSSALRRTRATAEAILAAQDAPPDIEGVDFLAEVDHGPDEDRTEDEVVARIGKEAIEAWDRDATPPPGWIVDGAERIAAWRRLAVEASGEMNVLLATSNGAGRFALLALGLEAGRQFRLRTGAWGVIEIGLDGTARLVEWDRRPE